MSFGIISYSDLQYVVRDYVVWHIVGVSVRNCSRIEIFIQFFDVTELNLTQPKKFVKICHLFLKAGEFCCTVYGRTKLARNF